MTEPETTPQQELAGAGPGPAGPGPAGWRGRLAVLAGSTTALVCASLIGSVLAFADKAACRNGDWNFYLRQFQAHCYTDIYPLYYGEGLSTGKVPYFGHPVEYPVVIGWAMQAVAWLVQPISQPYLRGREFFDITVVLLALFTVAGTLATAYLAGPARRWTALLVALSPALILAAFINWDLIAMSLVALGMAAWAGRRLVLAGALLGLAAMPSATRLIAIRSQLMKAARISAGDRATSSAVHRRAGPAR